MDGYAEDDEPRFDADDGGLFGGHQGAGDGDEHGVTDADFNFFDGPDSVPSLAADSERDGLSLDSNGAKSNVPASASSKTLQDGIGVFLGSAQPDTAPEIDIFTNEIVPPPPAQQSPQLSPEEVFKRLSVMGLQNTKVKQLDAASFSGLGLSPALSVFASKYGVGGRFVSPKMAKTETRAVSSALPMTGYMSKRRKIQPRSEGIFGTFSDTSTTRQPRQFRRLKREADGRTYDSRDGSPASDEDDTSSEESDQEATPAAFLNDETYDTQTPEIDNSPILPPSFMNQNDQYLKHLRARDSLQPGTPETTTPRFCSPRSLAKDSQLDDVDFVAAAQLLGAQAMSTLFRCPRLEPVAAVTETLANDIITLKIASKDQKDVLEGLAGYLKQLVSSRPLPEPTDKTSASAKPPSSKATPNNPRAAAPGDISRSIFQIAIPHVSVTRADTRLSVLPLAAHFWDVLGLGPAQGPKDVMAVCAYPCGPDMATYVSEFHEHVAIAYEASHLGSHTLLESGTFMYDKALGNSTGTHESPISDDSKMSLRDINASLGALLTGLNVAAQNFVVYYIYDEATEDILPSICAAFNNLNELYQTSFAAAKREVPNCLVLQLIPLRFVATEWGPAIPKPKEYSRLALEVYDRCVNFEYDTATPSVVLRRPLPRSIDFKLSDKPSASLLDENSVINVAYAKSQDGRWVSASWTDSTGSINLSASYCLGRESARGSLSPILAEIWDTTLSIIAFRPVRWRIMLARCGPMPAHEHDFWTSLAQLEAAGKISLTLIAVKTTPQLRIVPAQPSYPPSALTPGVITNNAGTPGSTPAGTILSPEPSHNSPATPTPNYAGVPATPTDSHGAEAVYGPDAYLLDLREVSWGVIEPSPVQAADERPDTSTQEQRPQRALAAGHIIKMGSQPDAVPTLGVDVLHCGSSTESAEAVLREVLVAFRGLAVLARCRNRVGPDDVRPWHVVVAERACDVLERIM